MRFIRNMLLIAGLLSCNLLFAQNRIVKGTVIDSEEDFPIIGTQVTVGNNGTITDGEGHFSISVEPGERLMHFKTSGYHDFTLILPDSLDTEITVPLRVEVFVDCWNRPRAQMRFFSYSPNVSLDLPDVHRIKIQTGRYVPRKKLVRLLYGKRPYYAAVSVLFEDKNGNTIHQKESKMMAKRLKVTPSDIIDIKGFVPVWIDNSSDTPRYCYE